MKQFRLILILWLCMAMNAKANETTANLLQQGDSCLSRYDVFHATQYYQKYLEANPSHLGARRKLASCYRKVGNYTACISCLDKIPSDSINHEDMRMYYYAYLNQNNNDKVSLWGERIAFIFRCNMWMLLIVKLLSFKRYNYPFYKCRENEQQM